MAVLWKRIISLYALQTVVALQGFNFPNIPRIFQPLQQSDVFQVEGTRQELESTLIKSISSTQYGKTASVEKQREVLVQVAALEAKYPAGNLKEILQSGAINGTWYLQFTAPSEIEGETAEEMELSSAWKIENPEENIPTERFEARGSVTAAGIDVDVSNKPAKQIFDLSENKVYNEVVLPNALVRVGGSFRLSENNDRRAVVKFEECKVDVGFLKLDLGFLFGIIRLVKGTTENGWLETTYLSDKLRIGRGNKGSLFVLTRDEGAVLP
eukprot:scaffold24028_cov152-Cylindrotheca_fusiformis.AAC.9